MLVMSFVAEATFRTASERRGAALEARLEWPKVLW